jgi:hypothetical protein
VTTWQQFASRTIERKIFSREECEVGEGLNKIFFPSPPSRSSRDIFEQPVFAAVFNCAKAGGMGD